MKDEPNKKPGILTILFRAARVLIVLGVAVFLAFALISLKKEPEKKQIVHAPPSVKVVKVFPASKVMTVEAYGTIKPRHLVKIAFEVPGRIDHVHPAFTEGGKIQAGDILLRLDQRSYRLDREAAQVKIRQAKTDIENFKQDVVNLENDLGLSQSNVKLAKKELDRIKALVKNAFASKNSLDKMEQQYLQARIGLQSIKNRLSLTDTLMAQKQTALTYAGVDFDRADLALKKTRIVAGFDGFILEKTAEQGDYINPGQMVGTMFRQDSLDVDVAIPLEKMKWIESFFENGNTPEAKVMLANFDSLSQIMWNARVARIKARVDEKTRTLPMTLEILNPDIKIKGIFNIKPGTFVKCIIQGETIDNLFVVPRHLLKPGDLLYTVTQGRLKIKKVEILRKFEEQIYIQKGLEPGVQIISSPLPGALNGMELTIIENGN